MRQSHRFSSHTPSQIFGGAVVGSRAASRTYRRRTHAAVERLSRSSGTAEGAISKRLRRSHRYTSARDGGPWEKKGARKQGLFGHLLPTNRVRGIADRASSLHPVHTAASVIRRGVFHWWQRSAAASAQLGNLKVKPCSSSRPGTTRRLLRMSSVSVHINAAPSRASNPGLANRKAHHTLHEARA